ncbi:MAG: transporter substrate-binding domain-containing protein [Lachnospiraceae bacterium]|nr:transporter substrate-binding domain-containing protein [Lachnospiraceae bacterium]
MKRKIFALFLAVILVVSLTGCKNFLNQQAQEEKEELPKEIIGIETQESMKGVTLKIGVSPDFAPFTYMNSSGQMKGFDIDYIEALSIYLGFDYDLVVEQMKDIEKDVASGKLDCGIAGISMTNKRVEQFLFTDTYFENSMTLVVAKGVTAESRKDILHMKLGAERGTSSAEYVKDNLKKFNNKIKYYDNLSAVFKALEKGKVDAAVLDSTSYDYYMEKHPDSTIVSVETNLYTTQSNYAIMCNKDFAYEDEFNVGMKQIDLDGIYQEIYNKWFSNGKSEE